MSTPAQLSPGSVDARSSAGARAPAGRPVPVWRARPRGRLLRLGEGRPDAALHGLGLRHLAAGRAGIAALYLWGVRWWPGVFIAELVVNGELLVGQHPLPLGSLLGQQAGNMAEVVVGRPAAAAAHRPARGDRSRGAGRRAVRGPGGRDGDQRDRGDGLDAGRRRHLGRRGAHVLADVVARRRRRRVWSWCPLVLAWAAIRGGAWRRLRTAEGALLHRHRRDPRCARRVHQRARHLRGLPRADLGGVQVRHARRHAVDRDRDRRGDRHHRQRRRAVLQAADRPQDPEHAGLHRRDRDDDAVPRRRGQRAGAGSPAAGRRPSAARASRRCRSATGSRATCTTPSRRRCSPRCCTPAPPRRRSRREARRTDASLARDLDAIGELTLAAQTEIRNLISELGRDPLEDGLVPALVGQATRLVRGEGPSDRSACARRSPPAGPARRGAGLRHRARGAGQRRQARAGEHGVDQRRGTARDAWSSRSATTASASSRTSAIPATSASSRCAAARPRSGRS